MRRQDRPRDETAMGAAFRQAWEKRVRRDAQKRDLITAGTPKLSGVSCPACGAENAEPDYRAHSTFLWHCFACGHQW